MLVEITRLGCGKMSMERVSSKVRENMLVERARLGGGNVSEERSWLVRGKMLGKGQGKGGMEYPRRLAYENILG
jgi:hypothetical protein